MDFSEQWLPRSITAIRNDSARQFTHDLASGITVGLVALPLAMAFGVARDGRSAAALEGGYRRRPAKISSVLSPVASKAVNFVAHKLMDISD